MDILEVIHTKRDGGELTEDQIRWFIEGYTRGDDVSDEQAASLLMAIFFRGLNGAELSSWTQAMLQSGERLDLSSLGRPTVDKHSTGGVGDKVSLIVVPMLAACGAAVPQLSGRGLGHTGGTLDKMEAIPGWRAQLTNKEFFDQLDSVGCVIAGAGDSLAPADQKMYALRDVTGTVESIPLIASSIMSKKIAEGTDALVLDVKVGSGAFLKTHDEARELATRMIELGRAAGVKTSAVLTDMNSVLGHAVGNAVEVRESIDVLRGEGPQDVVDLSITIAREMARLAGIPRDPAETLETGEALQAFDDMVAAQSGRLYSEQREAALPNAPVVVAVPATSSGIVQTLDALSVGIAAWRLGAGRAQKEDPVSAVAGVICLVQPGDKVEEGQPVFELHTDDQARVAHAKKALRDSVTFGDSMPELASPVIEMIS